MVDPWEQQRGLIRQVLKDEAVSQAWLADYLGVSEKHLSQMLTGKANGSVYLWVEMATALGYSWTLTKSVPEA